MNKKPAEIHLKNQTTTQYAAGIFFVLTSVGIAVLSLVVINQPADIRRQASNPYCAPEVPGDCCDNTNCAAAFTCVGASTYTPGHCVALVQPTATPGSTNHTRPTSTPTPTTASSRNVPRATSTPVTTVPVPTATFRHPTITPRPTEKGIPEPSPTPDSIGSHIPPHFTATPAPNQTEKTQLPTATPVSNQTGKAQHPTATPVNQGTRTKPTDPPSQTTKSDTRLPTVPTSTPTTNTGSTTKSDSDTTTGSDSKPASATNTIAAVGSTWKSIQIDIDENNRTANSVQKTIGDTFGETTKSNTALAQTAQTLLGITSGLQTGFTSSNSSSGTTQTTTPIVSSQQYLQTPKHLPEAEVLNTVVQVAAVNRALVRGSSENKDSLHVVVENQGKLINHTVPVTKNADGTVDQAALQTAVSTAIAQPESGQVIPQASVNTVMKPKSQTGVSAVLSGVTDTLTTVFGGQTAKENSAGVRALQTADIIVSAGDAMHLPVSAPQIGVNFDNQHIVITQTSSGSVDKALAQEITPVSEQLQLALNAVPSNQTTNTSKPVVLSTQSPVTQQAVQDTHATAERIAQKVGTTGTAIVQTATIQTIARQLGAQAASVEYISGDSTQKAFIPTTSGTTSLQTAANELANAAKGERTVGSTLSQFAGSSGITRSLQSIAFPGISTLAKQSTVDIKVVHVTGDLNQQPDINLNIQTISNQGRMTTPVQGIILFDDLGNQKVQVSGSENADSLQQAIQVNPQGFLNLVQSNLEMTLK